MKERIEYYEERLYFLLRECENKESSERAMEKYKDKIETLIDEYRTFKDHPKYNPFLPDIIESIVLKNAK